MKCTGPNKYMGDNFNGWAKWYLLKLLDSSFRLCFGRLICGVVEYLPISNFISKFQNQTKLENKSYNCEG